MLGLCNFEGDSPKAVFDEFAGQDYNYTTSEYKKDYSAFGNIDDIEIIIAFYEYENYSGEAYVLFKQDGQLYEVFSGHCSCYGLEGTWDPEEVTIPYMRRRLLDNKDWGRDYGWRGNPGENTYRNEVKNWLTYQ